ncbi:hypothetical protein HPP92_011609 [Vanilla planifolia]|uniref:Uncharacterized protein n=1 Tax=Vanilla planifolia TaxID=51239 RepID=A0A835R8S9_VANPL|nr:hypothetical protein HPP92_011609 [Vanilla planifolia]
MAEEQRCQEGHRPCANNCGFCGSPATMDFCSKCYRDLRLKEEQASSAIIAVEKSLLPLSSSSSSASVADPGHPSSFLANSTAATAEPSKRAVGAEDRPTAAPGRCTECRKRVGLTGFRCRCELTFCGAHRYPEQHRCSFDFKAAGREAIARANPVVKASKLDKI